MGFSKHYSIKLILKQERGNEKWLRRRVKAARRAAKAQ
jgi:hypothetical protein